ncbi:MAG TPA: caspase family protein [Pyrinomonadaceae bacterium]
MARLLPVALSAFLAVGASGAAVQAQPGGREAGPAQPRPSASAQQRQTNPPPDRRGLGVPTPTPPADATPGRYLALVIGNDAYQKLPRLRTAVADATAVAQLLRDDYGFETNVKLDASRSDILSELYRYRVRLDEADSLLIYYAGHGYLDNAAQKAYWLPVDATNADPANWISSDDITTSIRALPARHVLIVSDSCYSGGLGRGDRSGLGSTPEPSARERAERGRARAIQRLRQRMSRTLMASGGDEPVQDSRGDQKHSIFANALLRALREMDGDTFAAADLFHDQKIRDVVEGNSEQQPEYSPLRNSGHDGGDFIFSRRVSLPALVGATAVARPRVQPGETFTQTITITNQGNGDARAARVEFVFNPNFEFIAASPAAESYNRLTHAAAWNLGEVAASRSQLITVTLRAAPDALAASYPLGAGTLRTASLPAAASLTAPPIEIGRESKAQLDALKTDLIASPGATVYLPFVVRNPGNYAEAYELRVTAPGAPQGTLYADTNGDGRHQPDEPAVTQTPPLTPRTGQYPLLLKVDAPPATPTSQQFPYNVSARARSAQATSEATTTLTVAAAAVSSAAPPRPAPESSPTPELSPSPAAAGGDGPPEVEQAMFNKGRARYEQKRYEEAAAVFSDFLKTYPSSIITDLTLMWLGRSYIAAGRLADAEQIGERLRAIKNTPFLDVYQAELDAARKTATPPPAPAATPESAPAKPQPTENRRSIFGVASSDTPAGARVTITSESPLGDYSAYRSGDRFYVVIPNARIVNGAGGVRGRGFDDAQVSRRGNDVVLFFKLQPGASAHVEQRFNRLVVRFSVPNK